MKNLRGKSTFWRVMSISHEKGAIYCPRSLRLPHLRAYLAPDSGRGFFAVLPAIARLGGITGAAPIVVT